MTVPAEGRRARRTGAAVHSPPPLCDECSPLDDLARARVLLVFRIYDTARYEVASTTHSTPQRRVTHTEADLPPGTYEIAVFEWSGQNSGW